MNVGEFFTQLSFGTLSNLSIGMEGVGQIKPEEEDKVVFHINGALKQLYSRLTHNRDYVKFELVDGVQRYQMSSAFAVSNTDAGNTNPRYLKDSAQEPFTDDLVKILSICQEDDETTPENEAAQIGINVNPALGGVVSLSYDTFFIPNPIAGTILTVEYQTLHPKLSIPADKSEKIFVAPILEDALELKVAARIYASMNGEAHVAKASQLEAAYERIIQTTKDQDLLQETSISGIDRLRAKGFN